jgi:hypothetical protein
MRARKSLNTIMRKLVFAIFAIGPAAIEEQQQEIQAMTNLFAQTPIGSL